MTLIKSAPVASNARGTSGRGKVYAEDCYAWTQQQAALLRDQKTQGLDFANLAEEIESLGHSDKRELGNRLQLLVRHLLQWRYQGAGGR